MPIEPTAAAATATATATPRNFDGRSAYRNRFQQLLRVTDRN